MRRRRSFAKTALRRLRFPKSDRFRGGKKKTAGVGTKKIIKTTRKQQGSNGFLLFSGDKIRMKLIIYTILFAFTSFETFRGALTRGVRGVRGVLGTRGVRGVFGDCVACSPKAGITSVSMILKKFNINDTSFRCLLRLDPCKIIGVCLVGKTCSLDLS